MKTILNVALGVALAFCIISILSGSIEKQINEAVETALSERFGAVEESAPSVDPAEESTPTTKPAAKPVDNRSWIDVRGPKGNVKLYVGQPKDEVLQILGTPDSFDFGGTYEDCSYTVGNAIMPNLKIEFERGKLKNIRKYNY